MHKYFSMIFRYFVIFTLIIGGNNSFSNEPQANESELQLSERVSIIHLTLEAKEKERQRKEIKARHKEERREIKDRHRTERDNTRGEERRETKARHREEIKEIKARHRTERRDRERTFGSDAESVINSNTEPIPEADKESTTETNRTASVPNTESTSNPNEKDIHGEVTIETADSREDKEYLNGFSPEELEKNPERVEALKQFVLMQKTIDKQITDGLYPIDPHTRQRTTLLPRMWNQVKGFPVEAMVFYAAIGASIYRKAQTDMLMKGGKTDPRWLEAFINDQLTSPIGIFSFFCFVLASGASSHLYSKVTGAIGGPMASKALETRRNKIQSSPTQTNIYNHQQTQAKIGKRVRIVNGFAGQIGMSFGLLASNIVHEIYNLYSHNPNFKRCRDEGMSSENAALACSGAWNELGHTALSWAPGLASMLTAATLSHALVRGLFKIGKRGAGKFIYTPFLPRVSITIASATGLVKAASLITLIIPGTFFLKSGMLAFRFINLYAFMEIEQLFTHHLWDWMWGEGQKADGLAYSMENFIKHHDVEHSTPWRHCKDTENKDCEYHNSIYSIHYASDSFNRWRQYKMQMASMAHQSWFLYVSNALGSFDLAYNIYRNLFLSKKDSNRFNEVKYLGDTTLEKVNLGTWNKSGKSVPTPGHYIWNDNSLIIHVQNTESLYKNKDLKALKGNSLFIDDNQIHITDVLEKEEDILELVYTPVKDNNLNEYKEASSITFFTEGKAFIAFRNMQQKLEDYLEQESMEAPEDLEVNIVSHSPDRFLKPIKINNGWLTSTKWWENRHFISHALFSAQDPNVPLQPFYGEDYRTARRAIREEILQNTLNTTDFLNNYLTSLETTLSNFREVMSKAKDIETQQDIETQIMTVLQFFRLLQLQTVDAASKASTFHYELNLPQCSEDSFNFQFSCLARSLQIEREEETSFLSWYLKGLLEIFSIDSSSPDYENVINSWLISWELPLTEIEQFVKDLKQEVLISSAYLDENKVEEKINIALRNRVLAAGVEYLNEILEIEKSSKKGATFYLSAEIRDKQRNEEIPAEVYSTFVQVGEDNIFAQLYADAYQIKPKVRGMDLVVDMNERYKVREKLSEVDYHPSQLQNLRTPNVMDFLIASAICGPELQGEEHIQLLQSIEDIKKGQSSLEESFSEEEGIFGMMGNMIGNIIRGTIGHGKLILTQIFEDRFPGLQMDDIINQIPVFNRPRSGFSFAFYPPRIVSTDERTRKEICSGIHSQNTHGVVENIYDIPRPIIVNDKEYSNLLFLVQDHINKEGISSVEEFDTWWKQNIAPYRELFIWAADREYKRMMEYDFMKPLFRNDGKEINIDSPMFAQNDSDTSISIWEQISVFSKEDFIDAGIVHRAQNKRSRNNRLSLYKVQEYSVDLPRGVFQSMIFELNYWADMVLHFGKKREKYFMEHSDHELHDKIHIAELENGLRDLINHFNLKDCAADTDTLKTREQIETCKNWVKDFMNPENLQTINAILEGYTTYDEAENEKDNGIASSLYVHLAELSHCKDPYSPGSSFIGYSTEEQQKEMARQAYSCFTKNSISSRKIGEDPEKALLPDQLLNFSLMRLQGILEEAINYANMINNISEYPNVTDAQKSEI